MFKQISHHLNALLRFNVWVEAIVERVNNFFVIKDTSIRQDIGSANDGDHSEEEKAQQ